MKPSWIQLKDISNARVLLILPCNAAACIGNYFRAEVYNKRGWNTWREADVNLQDLRREGRVAFAALDSSVLETQPQDPRGAIVLETEMYRAKNPDGEDWGPPSWRWFRPNPVGQWRQLGELTGAVKRGVHRVDGLGFSQVIGLINPRAYFLALAAAVRECGLLDRWVLFRIPPHPRFLLKAAREVIPIVRAATKGAVFPGGIYCLPDLYAALHDQEKNYRHSLPMPWQGCNQIPRFREVKKRWESLLEDV